MIGAQDLAWLKTTHPSLRFNGTAVTGKLSVDMAYDSATSEYTIFPSPAQVRDGGIIYHVDEYSISLTWPTPMNKYPTAHELDGKIRTVALEKQLPLVDLHLNNNGDLCLATPQDLERDFDKGFSLELFFNRYLIPYLFLQTHFRLEGVWAWTPAEHGLSGILGWHYLHSDTKSREITLKHLAQLVSSDNVNAVELLHKIRKDRYKGHMPCLCGSNIPPRSPKRIRDCCPNALLGLNNLRLELIPILIKKVGS